MGADGRARDLSFIGHGCAGGATGGSALDGPPVALGPCAGRGSCLSGGPKMSRETPGGNPSIRGFLETLDEGNGTEANGSVGDSIGPAFRTPQSPPGPQPSLRQQ
jgi:hypothetical protein